MSFTDHGIYVKEASGHTRTICPECSPGRRKSTDPCLSVDTDNGLWFCHHCGWSGALNNGYKHEEIKTHFQKPEYRWTDLPANVVEWFKRRGIDEYTLKQNQIGYGQSFKDAKAIQFPYFRNGEVVNIKHRTKDKRFRQEKNAEKCLYRFDEIAKGGETLIITEGEVDALSFQAAGFNRVCSIPDGAPSAEAKEYRTKFDFLKSAEEIVAQYPKVIIATDGDEPGRVAEKELARRIGIEKCYRVEYPAGCKDANDVLVKLGKDGVSALVNKAQQFPIEGVFSIGDLKGDLEDLYDRGVNRGYPTGWETLNDYYTVKPGELCIITGIPGSGKSEWLDALQVNLIASQDLRFAVCSPENWPPERHAQKYLEKVISRPFGRHGFERERMHKSEIAAALQQIRKHVFFIMPPEMITIDVILEKTKQAIFRHGVNGLVIDPWNEIEHTMERGQREDLYISQQLSKLRRFARKHQINVWLVAHPQKLQKDKDTGTYKPPTMYEISGGAQWRNKADVGICVHRPNYENDETEVYIQKIRFKEVGRIGKVTLKYNRDTGEYRDIPTADERY